MMNCNVSKFSKCVLLNSSNHQEHKRTRETSAQFARGSVMGVKNLGLYDERLLGRFDGCKYQGGKLTCLALRDAKKRIFINFSVTG